jgi:hypothetical protein
VASLVPADMKRLRVVHDVPRIVGLPSEST